MRLQNQKLYHRSTSSSTLSCPRCYHLSPSLSPSFSLSLLLPLRHLFLPQPLLQLLFSTSAKGAKGPDSGWIFAPGRRGSAVTRHRRDPIRGRRPVVPRPRPRGAGSRGIPSPAGLRGGSVLAGAGGCRDRGELLLCVQLLRGEMPSLPPFPSSPSLSYFLSLFVLTPPPPPPSLISSPSSPPLSSPSLLRALHPSPLQPPLFSTAAVSLFLPKCDSVGMQQNPEDIQRVSLVAPTVMSLSQRCASEERRRERVCQCPALLVLASFPHSPLPKAQGVLCCPLRCTGPGNLCSTAGSSRVLRNPPLVSPQLPLDGPDIHRHAQLGEGLRAHETLTQQLSDRIAARGRREASVEPGPALSGEATPGTERPRDGEEAPAEASVGSFRLFSTPPAILRGGSEDRAAVGPEVVDDPLGCAAGVPEGFESSAAFNNMSFSSSSGDMPDPYGSCHDWDCDSPADEGPSSD